jgi:threonine dehydratase
MKPLPRIAEIDAAAARIHGAVERTPQSLSRTLSDICGCVVVLKFENLQYTASFKERGALNKLLLMPEQQRRAGVIACSAGNHAQGVAYHAQRLAVPAVIVMPENTPFTKVVQTERFGAEVVLYGNDLGAAQDRADVLARERSLALIHPYDDAEIIAGQGTIAREMLEDDPALESILVPVGGGGLISGIAIAARALKPSVEVIGVEAALYPAMSQVLRGEEPSAGGVTIAEGIAVKRPGHLTRKIVQSLVTELLLVSEDALEDAVRLMLEIEKSVAEGAGAAGLAALLSNRQRFAGKRVGVVVSGGNIDARLLSAILMRGLVRSGRLVRIRVDISDQPGLLGKVANLIGASGGNIVEVYHQRLFHDVPLKMAELDVVIETRDPQHVHAILSTLRDAGLPANLLSNITGAEIH